MRPSDHSITNLMSFFIILPETLRREHPKRLSDLVDKVFSVVCLLRRETLLTVQKT